MYFFLVEITYLYFFGDVFLSRCILQMKSHLVIMLNKVLLCSSKNYLYAIQ